MRLIPFVIFCFLLAACAAQPNGVAETATQEANLATQLSFAQEDFNAHRYDLALQRLEYIQERQPDYPGVAELLAKIPTATPLSATSKPNYLATERIRATQFEATSLAELKPTLTPVHPLPTKTMEPTLTMEPTFTAPAPRATPVFLGTALPGTQPIGWDNFAQLDYVGQWGKGNILAMAASPDGKIFVVGSAFGMAIYKLSDSQSPPGWVMFEAPFVYENLFFSQDGSAILLEYNKHHQVRSFPDGKLLQNQTGVSWIEHSERMNSDDEAIYSPDGKFKFVETITHDENMWDFEFSNREIHDGQSDNLLYKLPDETAYVQYNDNQEPEGCDLDTFGYCGNAYVPSALHPYRVGFSPTLANLAVLYRAPNRWNANEFSTLRLYDLKNGKFLQQIGSFSHPVETFAYFTDGRILVGYVNGSIEIWNPGQEKSTFSAWHFNSPVERLDYSNDGKYLYIQRQGELEVRQTSNGALFKRFDASTYALSPVENLVAIADEEGNIRLQTVDGQGDQLIKAHKARVYAMAFSPDGKMLVSAGKDCAIRAWDVKTGLFLHPFEKTVVDAYGEGFTASRIFIHYFKFISGTTQLLGFGSWGTAVSWNINSGATNYVIASAPLESYQGLVTLNPHFPEFFGVDLTGNKFYINEIAYDLTTGQKLSDPEQPAKLSPGCYATGPTSADGSVIFTIGYKEREGQICILDAKDRHIVGQVIVIPQNVIFEDIPPYPLISWLYVSPDGKQLMVKTVSGALLIYQVIP